MLHYEHKKNIPSTESPNFRFNKFEIVKRDDLSMPQTGLGLALCRMVAEAHGGRIYVETRQPRGSVFTVDLPDGTAP